MKAEPTRATSCEKHTDKHEQPNGTNIRIVHWSKFFFLGFLLRSSWSFQGFKHYLRAKYLKRIYDWAIWNTPLTSKAKYQLYHTSARCKEINYIYRELVNYKHNVKPSLLLKHRQVWIILWDCKDRLVVILPALSFLQLDCIIQVSSQITHAVKRKVRSPNS
jgi:hypothetical protein